MLCQNVGTSATGRSTEDAVAADRMEMFLKALELREESQKREMWGNIAGQVVAIGGQALCSYLDYKYGDPRRGRSVYIPVPFQSGPPSIGSGSSFPSNALPWHMHMM